MAATIRAVAEAAGVSITTVSFVLNNKRPQVDAIPKTTRDRVRACAASLGYRRNPAAASLRTGRSLWVGVVMQQLKNEFDAWMWAPYELSLLSGVQKALAESNYLTVLGSKPYAGDEKESVDTLVSSGVGGLILRGPSAEVAKRIESMGDDRIPTVIVFPTHKDDLYPYSIDMDNVAAGELAARLFVKAGRKAPICVTNEGSRHNESDRARGFADTVERELSSAPLTLSLPAEMSDAERIVAMTDFIRTNRPDCVMATEAGNSFLVSFAAAGLGLSVPDDFSIIGFDCYSFRSAREQRVSAVGTSWWQAGQLAASSILDMMHNHTEWHEPKVLQPRFLPGDTTPRELADESDLYWLLQYPKGASA